VSIIAGDGLTGGGTLSTDRTLAINWDGSTDNGVVTYDNATRRPMVESNLVWLNSTNRLGVNIAAPTGTLHVSSSDQIALQVDSNAAKNAFFVSSSGAVAVGIGAHPTFLNHKFTVFSGSISLRGPSDPAFSYRLNDTGSTNRNAMYISSSNYLTLGNVGYTGLQLIHTGSFGTTYVPEGRFGVEEILGNNTDQIALGSPDNWLAVRINTINYLIPMYG